MEKEYVLQIAQTIKEQLVGMTPAPVIMSWGITEFAATIYRDLPALRIKLNGRLHTGYVMIVLNGSDYYEVFFDAPCHGNRQISRKHDFFLVAPMSAERFLLYKKAISCKVKKIQVCTYCIIPEFPFFVAFCSKSCIFSF